MSAPFCQSQPKGCSRSNSAVKILGDRIEFVSTEAVNAYANSARRHPRGQIRRLMRGIEKFGVLPIIIDAKGNVIDGHAVLEALIQLGATEIPVIRVANLTDVEIRALRLFLNRVAEDATWDADALKLEFEAIIEAELSFDLDLTGFSIGEIDLLLTESASAERDPDDADADASPEQQPTAKLGDLWQLGRHRLFCGDALAETSWTALMVGIFAALVLTDPPYNVPTAGHITTRRDGRHGEFAMAAGEMSPDAFRAFLEDLFRLCSANSGDGALVYAFIDWRSVRLMLEAGEAVFGRLINICFWNKTNAGMGSFYRSQHEMICVFESGKGRHRNNVELGRHGRYRTNVWTYPGANSFGSNRDTDLADHPTVKPVALLADAIMDSTARGDIVVDPFAGSGSVILAAERTGRIAHAIEIEPGYVDVAIRRWQARTGEKAIHARSGLDFDTVAAMRREGKEPVRRRVRPRRLAGGAANA